MLLRRALRRASIGVGGGLLLAPGAGARDARDPLRHRVDDPVAFLAMAPVLFGIVTLGTLIPALRAIRSSPLAVLREG